MRFFSIGAITRELRRIADALERLSPPTSRPTTPGRPAHVTRADLPRLARQRRLEAIGRSAGLDPAAVRSRVTEILAASEGRRTSSASPERPASPPRT